MDVGVNIGLNGVGWAGDSQPNKTLVCIGVMLGCQRAVTQACMIKTTQNQSNKPKE